jgi:S-adenosylmethionine decarboxylase proenzyme
MFLSEVSEGVGEHVLADLFGVSSDRLKDESQMMGVFAESLEKTPLTILGRAQHKFTSGGEGVTGVFLLSQSHAAFHSYPEAEYLAVDIFSCGVDFGAQVIKKVCLLLGAEQSQVTTVRRPGAGLVVPT